MALNQLSPGVNVREIDLTNFIPNVGVSGGAFVGKFAWGPVMDYTIISDSNRLATVFGKPNDTNYVDWYSVSNFLQYTNDCNVVRVIHDVSGAATAFNSVAKTGDTGTLTIKNDSHFQSGIGSPTYNGYNFAARFPGKIGNSLKVIIADIGTFDALPANLKKLFDGKPGTSEEARALGIADANDELHMLVIDEQGLFTGVPGSILEKYAFLSKASDAKALDGAPNFFGNVVNKISKYIRYLGSDFPSTVLATGRSVASTTITTAGTNYKIGDKITFTAPTGGGLTATATVTNATKKGVASVAVSGSGTGYVDGSAVTFSAPTGGGVTATGHIVVTTGNITSVVVDGAGSGYAVDEVVTATVSGAGSGQTLAVTMTTGGAVTAVTINVPGEGYDDGQVVSVASVTNSAGGVGTGTSLAITGVLTTKDSVAWELPFISPNTGEKSSYAKLISSYSQLFSGGSDGGDLDAGDLIAGWDMFRNSEEVDVSLLFVGHAGGEVISTYNSVSVKTSEAVINHVITNVAESRKDCVVFFSPDKSDVVDQSQEAAAENIINTRNALETNSSYAVMDSGWKLQYDVFNDKYRWLPLNADIAGLCASTDMNFDPWWSPAGFTRGKVKGVVALAFNPNRTQRDDLYSNNVNPVVSFRGEGVVLYGDKTLQVKASAFQYINVRRLFIILEKAISKASQYQLFEFNDQFTRSQFRNMVEPYLREVQGRRGIYDFKVVCDETNNTPEVIDHAEFVASIFIKPARSINFITLNFVAVRTGVEFSEVVGAV